MSSNDIIILLGIWIVSGIIATLSIHSLGEFETLKSRGDKLLPKSIKKPE